MTTAYQPGLGELLRHLSELCDDSSDSFYSSLAFPYRARYTPLLRLLGSGPKTVSEITQTLAITQGAVSQSIKLMQADGLITRRKSHDARQSIITLTAHGKKAGKILQAHWDAIFGAIAALEIELRMPLRDNLQQAIAALNTRDFAARIAAKKNGDDQQAARASYFQHDGARYAAFRPSYPQSLADELANLAPANTLALDIGCGNGQFSRLLARHFKRVTATDISAGQIANATGSSNIDYRVEGAENISADAASADLIVAAQAAHWFDLPAFYAECRRIAKPGAILALISYGVPYIDDAANAVFQQGYWQDIHRFWPSERRHVENAYSALELPFSAIAVSGHHIERRMRFQEFCGYISTWSAWRVAEQQNAQAVFEHFLDKLQPHWPQEEEKRIVWPLAVKAGVIS